MSFFYSSVSDVMRQYGLSETRARKLVSKERSEKQDEAFLTRLLNQQYIEEHPHQNYALGMHQVVPLETIVRCLSKKHCSNARVYNQIHFLGSEVNLNTVELPFATQSMIKHDFHCLSRKGTDFTRVCECKLQSRRTKKSVTLPKVLMIVYSCFVKNGFLDGVFFTATFSDEYLATHNKESMRRDIREWAASQGCDMYVINIDYGKKNGRVHYHMLFNGRVSVKSYHKRFRSKCFAEPLFGDWEHITYYVTKLTNHGVKETTIDPSHSSMINSPSLVHIRSIKQVRELTPMFDVWYTEREIERQRREDEVRAALMSGSLTPQRNGNDKPKG